MANRLKMAEHQAILGLVRLNWSYRRIAAVLGIDRETVSRHVKAAVEAEARSNAGAAPPEANATISITGSSSPDPEIGSSPRARSAPHPDQMPPFRLPGPSNPRLVQMPPFRLPALAVTGKRYRLRNRAAADDGQQKQKGRRSTADGEEPSPPEDTEPVMAVSSGVGVAQPGT